MPKYSTCWIPFTDACPDNSCLHVIPRGDDPGYFEGDDPDSDPMQVALSTKESYQNIKCIPAETGSVVLFSHRILHWGSKGREGYHTPRIAFSFANSSEDFEPHYFSNTHLPFPNLNLRIALSGGQMLSYWDRFQLTNEELIKYYDLFKLEKEAFHKTYIHKISNEFLKAINLQQIENEPTDRINDEEDDVIDEALDALLDENLDDFHDDFQDCEDIQPVTKKHKH